MADTVTNRVIFKGGRRIVVHLTNESDGSGETKVKKINLDDLRLHNGNRPASLTLVKAEGSVSGLNYVTLYWQRNPADIPMLVIPGNGQFCLQPEGGMADPKREEDGTGDILLSTDGAADGDAYDITLEFKLK
jgi:hypothetical protein